MIILFNLILILIFFIKSFFYKNEFSLVKTVYRYFINSINFLFNFSETIEFFSFKKFTKVYLLIKSKISQNNKSNINSIIYIYYILTSFKTKWFLVQLFDSQKNIISKNQFNFSKNTLNSFLVSSTYDVNESFIKNFNSSYTIKFRSSSFVTYANNSINTLFIRKNKIFNKGRYSRNRQLYRTGVYWCIWLSVFLGYCLYFSFYRFTLNFGYQWWMVFGFLFLFINQKMFKYNFYNIKIVINEIKKNFNWISLVSYNFFEKIIRN